MVTRFFLYIITTVLASFYLFPVYFKVLPSVNTKMAMAGIGLMLLGYRLAKNRVSKYLDNGFLILTLWAIAISLASLLTMSLNSTNDSSFLRYVISMWVWMGGAYLFINVIRGVHGHVGVRLVSNYLIAVCTVQCILAIIFSFNPTLDQAVCGVLGGEETYLSGDTGDRLHGFGASLDVAGLKFAAAITIIACLVTRIHSKNILLQFFIYLSCLFTIVVFGDMISRTTIIGFGIATIVWIVRIFSGNFPTKLLSPLIYSILGAILLSVVLYNTNDKMRDNMRFGFEGFFSLAEHGEWRSNSNEDLKSMIVWPDNLRTWLIGDGYAANPNNADGDSYYTGPTFHGFYMGTDIGYCRFIFYFGLLGTVIFIMYFVTATRICINRMPQWSILFLCLLAINLIGWCKVSTDIFVVFAPFLCLTREDETEAENFYDNSETLENRVLHTGS